MYLEQFFIEGLGCASYLVGCEARGVAAVVDPDRDVQKYLDAAHDRGLTITHIIETHLHADHVSGNTELAGRTGAKIFIHEAGRAEFPHEPLRDGEVLRLGNVRLHVRHTPGHTPDSITLVVSDTTRADEPWLALTGDTLFVGDIGRPDLVGADAARALAGHMHESLFGKLLPMHDSLLIYPGHGAGSLCGKNLGAMRSTTLGYERRFNAALAPRPRADFIEFATSELPEQPANHQRIKAANRRGPKPLSEIIPRPISIRESLGHFRGGAALVDLRPKAEFVALHVLGAVHLAPDAQLSSRAGFLLPAEAPLILLLADPEQYARVVYALARVGYDNVIGYLSAGLDEWQRQGLPVASGDVRDIDVAELQALRHSQDGSPLIVLDVREPWEFRQGHVPGAKLVPLGELHARISELDAQHPVAVICASGNRSQSGAALLVQRGFATVYNVMGGTDAWQRDGFPLE